MPSEFEKKKSRRRPDNQKQYGADKPAFHSGLSNEKFDERIQRKRKHKPDKERNRPCESPLEKGVIQNDYHAEIEKPDKPVFFRFRVRHARKPPVFYIF